MNINNIKLAPRLTIGFGIVVIIGMVIAFSAALKLQTLADGLGEVATNRMAKVGQFTDLLDNFNVIGRSARDILLSDDPAFRDGEKKQIALKRAANAELLTNLTNTVRIPRNAELVKAINDNRSTYNGAIDRAVGFAENGDRAAASGLLLGEVSTLQNIVFKAVDDSRDLQQAIAAKLAKDAAQTASQGTILMVTAAAAMLIAGALLSWLITRSITRPIGRAVTHAEAISQGDLAAHPEVQGRDEVAQLLTALGVMQESLSGIVGQVREGSEGVSTASAEIASGTNDLSARTEQQASALEETAASMEELTSTVQQNADSAREAAQLAKSASGVAIKGGEVVNEVVATMKDINDSSKKISDIISVIDGIAFQTNILALNAAVEAARAGEQGRGFAVVASEVRSLAGRSADAAKEIKTLITASVERVEQGTVLVDQAGSTMTEVVESIKRVTDIMGEISAASNEQALGVAQIGEAVQQMDQVTQQNAALVEEMAAAATSLKSQSNDLVQTVDIFKLEGGQINLAPSVAMSVKAATPTVRIAASTARPLMKPKTRTMRSPTATVVAAGDAGWSNF